MNFIYNLQGVFSPFFGSQLTIVQEILDISVQNADIQRIKLFFESTPTSNKELPTGKFTIATYEGTTETKENLLENIQLNHARNFSSYRRDVVHWQIDIDTDTTFTVWFYNHVGTKVYTGYKGKILALALNNNNCIHYAF